MAHYWRRGARSPTGSPQPQQPMRTAELPPPHPTAQGLLVYDLDPILCEAVRPLVDRTLDPSR
jgi:hypothetical protein